MSRLITRFWPHGYFVVWESVWFQLFLFCWKAFRLRCRHAANTQPLAVMINKPLENGQTN